MKNHLGERLVQNQETDSGMHVLAESVMTL